MKLEFSESTASTEISLVPESANEMAALLRMVKNSKAEKPELYLSFSGDNPWAIITIRKYKPDSNKIVGAFSNNKH